MAEEPLGLNPIFADFEGRNSMPRVCVSPLAMCALGVLAAAGGWATAARAESVGSIQRALELSKKSGRPIFAVAGTES